MKYTPLLLFAIYCILSGSSFSYKLPAGRGLIKDYVFIPAGGEGDSVIPEFYISAIEVTNAQYRAFIRDLIDSGATDKLKAAMVDTLQWAKVIPSSKPFVHYYFQHPAYDGYPVVNVSRRGAELYCQWLTERYNSTSKQKARFSLPTESQWEYAAQGGNSRAIYPWPGNSITYDKKGKFHDTQMCNYRVGSLHSFDAARKQNDTADITAPARSFIPNTYDIYNMGGNVAEMLADTTYTKGGSYMSPAEKVLISAHEDTDLRHGWPTVGFRPVMVLATN